MTAPTTCPCSNTVTDGDDRCCQWCLEADDAKARQSVPHSWQTGRFTGTTTCSACGLLPVDPADSYSDCPGSR